MVSKASEDLPAPEGPVTTVTAPCGTRQSIPFRLWVRARSTWMDRILLDISGFRRRPMRCGAVHHNANWGEQFPKAGATDSGGGSRWRLAAFACPVPVPLLVLGAEHLAQPAPERVAFLAAVVRPFGFLGLGAGLVLAFFLLVQLGDLGFGPALVPVAELGGGIALAEDLGQGAGAVLRRQLAGRGIDRHRGEARRLVEGGVATRRGDPRHEADPDRQGGPGPGEPGPRVVVVAHPDDRGPIGRVAGEPTVPLLVGGARLAGDVAGEAGGGPGGGAALEHPFEERGHQVGRLRRDHPHGLRQGSALHG